jgi:hypothetical protein
MRGDLQVKLSGKFCEVTSGGPREGKDVEHATSPERNDFLSQEGSRLVLLAWMMNIMLDFGTET